MLKYTVFNTKVTTWPFKIIGQATKKQNNNPEKVITTHTNTDVYIRIF